MTDPLATILERARAVAPFDPDDRGLVPLATARAILAEQPNYLGVPVDVGRTPDEAVRVAAAVRQWSALVSLDNVAELERALLAITWERGAGPFPARALIQRYGPETEPLLIRFFAGCVTADAVLSMQFPDSRELLVELGTPELFELLLKVRDVDWSRAPIRAVARAVSEVPELGDHKAVGLLADLIAKFAVAHPAVATAVLAPRAAAKDKRAKKLMKDLRLGDATPVTARDILAVLDRAAAGSAGDWPRFETGIEDDPETWEYFELRLVALRAGAHWAIVFERLSGSYHRWECTRVQRYFYGSRVRDPGGDTGRDIVAPFELDRVPDSQNGETLGLDVDGVVVRGPRGELRLTAERVRDRDSRPGSSCELDGDPGYNLRLRAYIDAFPGCFFAPLADLVALAGIGDPMLICDTTSFAHAVGKPRPGQPKASWRIAPSASATWKSIAKALADADPTAVVLGESNLDFRLHTR